MNMISLCARLRLTTEFRQSTGKGQRQTLCEFHGHGSGPQKRRRKRKREGELSRASFARTEARVAPLGLYFGTKQDATIVMSKAIGGIPPGLSIYVNGLVPLSHLER